LDKDGTPITFYGACSIGSLSNLKNSGTFNVHTPLKKARQK